MSDTTHEAPELLPCPFCGSAARYYHRHDTTGWSNTEWVCCSGDCGASTCMHETEEEAIAAWNTRSDDLVQAAVAAALREAANACVNEYLDDPQGTKSDTAYQHAVADCVTAILALIPEGAQAALDRVVAAERERIISVYRKLATGSTVGAGDGGTLVVQYVDPEQFAAAIREGGE